MRKNTAVIFFISIFIVSSFSVQASYYMLGPWDFKPVTDVDSYVFDWSKGTGFNSLLESTWHKTTVRAKVKIPTGSVFEELWCQVYDNADRAKVSVRLFRYESRDNGSGSDSREIFSDESSYTGKPGHIMLSDTSPQTNGNVNVTLTNSCSNRNCTYYSYYVEAKLPSDIVDLGGDDGVISPGGRVKSCAIYYTN